MSKILVSQNVTISNPTLKAIADDIANQLKLAADKVVLNHFAPQEFPVRIERGKRSFESILSPIFKMLFDEKKKAAHDRAKARFNKSLNERRKDFGRFADIDLHNSSSIRELSSNLSLPIQAIAKAELIEEKNKLFSPVGSTKKYNYKLYFKTNKLQIITEQDKINKLLKDKHQAMGGDTGILGKCTGWIYASGGAVICEHGAIYINNGKAFEVHGAIWGKYNELNEEVGILGRPTTDELTTPDGQGRFNHFDNGSIYWHPDLGAHEIHGAILEKWKALGWEQSFLGYPITDESATPDGIGRYNHFQNGSIYWTAKTGAWEVHGAIRDLWESLGWEQSELGYPVTDESPLLQNDGRYSRFERGEIHWYPQRGAFLAAFSPFNTLTLRCIRLHCLDETNPEVIKVLGKVVSNPGDQIRMTGILSEVQITTDGNVEIVSPPYRFEKVNLENNWDDGDWNCWGTPPHLISVSLDAIKWPKGFIATCLLIEDDFLSTELANKLIEKIQPLVIKYVQAQVAAIIVAGGVMTGNPELAAILLPIAIELTAYIVKEFLEWVKGWLGDDLFRPSISCVIDMPDAHCLFGTIENDGTMRSDNIYCFVSGTKPGSSDGQYEFWLDWMLSCNQ